MKNFDKKMQDKLSSYKYEETPDEEAVKRMMDKLDEFLPIEAEVKTMYGNAGQKNSMSMLLKVAASILFFGIVGYFTYSLNQVTIEVGNRAHQKITLPDGSTVLLNSDSKLSYNKLLWNFDRTIKMSGEAFFEVMKGEQFSVDSEQGITQVLGTSFNVFARKKKYHVRCRAGRVRVASKMSTNSVILTPGQAVKMEATNVHEFGFDTKKELDWRRGEFYYSAELFENVIEELERQYDLQIILPKSFNSLLYTGYFNNRNLDQSLKLICEPVGLTYEIKGNKIVLLTSD